MGHTHTMIIIKMSIATKTIMGHKRPQKAKDISRTKRIEKILSPTPITKIMLILNKYISQLLLYVVT